MNRRGFLGAMLAACSAPAIVRASSLMPIFARNSAGLLVPEVGGNTLLTIDMITKEALRVLEQNLIFARNLNDEWTLPQSSNIVVRSPRRVAHV